MDPSVRAWGSVLSHCSSPLWRKGGSGLSPPDPCSPTMGRRGCKEPASPSSRPPPAADWIARTRAPRGPPPLSSLARVGVQRSQAGKGALSQKQAGLTASAFPEARGRPGASGASAWMAELQNVGFADQLAIFPKAATAGEPVAGRWGVREKGKHSGARRRAHNGSACFLSLPLFADARCAHR